MKVNLGCGPKRSQKAGFVNCDLNPDFEPDLLLDVRVGLPWKDSSVQVVACENLFDSLERHEHTNLMQEIHRVLVSGGSLIFHCGDVAVNPDMCFGWPGFVAPYTRYLFNYYIVGEDAHENWKDHWDLPGFELVKIQHNENGIMIGELRKPESGSPEHRE